MLLPPPPRYRLTDRRERLLTIVGSFDSAKNVERPMIRMSGAWLEELGFSIGTRLVVTQEQGRLVLTRTFEPEQQGVRS